MYADRALAPSTTGPVFARVLVGVDGTEPGFEACRQAAVLAEPDAALEAVCVVHLSDAIQVGFEAAGAVDRLREEAASALGEAGRILGGHATTRFVNGFVTQALLREIDEFGATAVAIGSHGHSRASEILLGGVAGELLHLAECSVLLARALPQGARLPGRIAVGVDGSPESAAALDAAERLAERFDAELDVVVATRGKSVDAPSVGAWTRHARTVDAHPVEALVDASRRSGLLVVGSRGLHGIHALGSVSERVAHRATCSVLVVRRTAAP
jgi:nucleotide-binding universal stress UspA family protein